MKGVISGVGEVSPSQSEGLDLTQMLLTASRRAIDDAGLAPSDINGIVTEATVIPAQLPASDLAMALGMKDVRISARSSPVGAGILQAIGMAQALVDSGAADHVLTYFGVDWASRREGPSEYNKAMNAKAVIETPAGFAGPPLYMALMARRYAERYGLSDEQLGRLLSEVVIATRANALLHPDAQFRRTIGYDDYLQSPMIASPLRKADCCLLSDGAAAFVVSRRNVARVAPARMATIAGWSWADDQWEDASFYSQSELPSLAAASAAMKRALASAGMAVSDIDIRQVYDCFSITTIAQLEALGFCEPGGAAEYMADGALRTTGAHPTNTHGGLLAHAYLLGANHLAEAVHQLRHAAGERQVPDASTAMVGAGPGRQYCAVLLERGDA